MNKEIKTRVKELFSKEISKDEINNILSKEYPNQSNTIYKFTRIYCDPVIFSKNKIFINSFIFIVILYILNILIGFVILTQTSDLWLIAIPINLIYLSFYISSLILIFNKRSDGFFYISLIGLIQISTILPYISVWNYMLILILLILLIQIIGGIYFHLKLNQDGKIIGLFKNKIIEHNY